MMLGLVAFVMVLIWLATIWLFRHHFDEVGKAIIEDDLLEYTALYEQQGGKAVLALFEAGGHGQHAQGFRLIDASGKDLINRPIPPQQTDDWPVFPTDIKPDESGIAWLRRSLGKGKVITVGRLQLPGSEELWFARTNDDDIAALSRVNLLLFFALVFSAVLAVGPVVWFASRVLRPVRLLIDDARRIAREPSLGLRIRPPDAIPELRNFSETFNESLDRVQALTEELEAANDQLAHELRTPLARIRGNIEGILKSKEVSPEALDLAARSIEEITRSSSIIRDILSIRSGDSGAMRLNLEAVDLEHLVRETVDLYSASAEERGLRLEVQVEANSGTQYIDRQRVQQAICNLLDNAIAYTPENGKIEIQLSSDKGASVIRVRDTGPGLSEEDEERIWRRFVRGSAASASNPGIGLGLSLVRAVANAHHGKVGAVNRREGGSEFWIRLPHSPAFSKDE